VVEVDAIGQEHIRKGTLVLVEAMRLDGDFLPKARPEAACLARFP